MASPYPKKFLYEESSYMDSHYRIVLRDKNRLDITARFMTGMESADRPIDYCVTPSEEQWAAFEQELYLIDLESLYVHGICDGTWGDIWITFKRKVKASIQLGSYENLEPLHRAINPLTKCSEYPRGIFSWL